MKTAIELITEERDRQIEKEGWSEWHDDSHKRDQLAIAAATYALPDRLRGDRLKNGKPKMWPWANEWWKPGEYVRLKIKKPLTADRVRELVKAGALIAAEIDRLQRKD